MLTTRMKTVSVVREILQTTVKMSLYDTVTEMYEKLCFTVLAFHFTYYKEDNNVTIISDTSKNIIDSNLGNFYH